VKKFILMAVLTAIVVAALAIPAMARQQNNGGPNFNNNRVSSFADFWNRFQDNHNWHNERKNAAPTVSQSFGDQQASSGDVAQDFSVSNTGNNSNQCAGISGVANSGNVQNQQGVLQNGSRGDVVLYGGSLSVDGSSTTNCDQKVSQSSSAYSSGW
jgi:hypothetical protein